LFGFYPNQDLGEADVWPGYLSSTVNVDAHAVMKHLHRPTDEKRMVALLSPGEIERWLLGKEAEAHAMLRMFPAERLTVTHLLATKSKVDDAEQPPVKPNHKKTASVEPQGSLF
jgi:putative SOS response-associated peptidase YedK